MKKHATIQAGLSAMILSLAMAAAAPAAFAGVDASDAKHKAVMPISSEEFSFGRLGAPKKIGRTIAVDMHDNMRFVPGEIQVRQGETIRFAVRNQGKLLHEMVLGTMEKLKSHQEMMRKHPGMEHDEAYMTHVGPGKKGEMLWQFTEAGEFYYACLIPGHFEAGMVGKITVTKG